MDEHVSLEGNDEDARRIVSILENNEPFIRSVKELPIELQQLRMRIYDSFQLSQGVDICQKHILTWMVDNHLIPLLTQITVPYMEKSYPPIFLYNLLYAPKDHYLQGKKTDSFGIFEYITDNEYRKTIINYLLTMREKSGIPPYLASQAIEILSRIDSVKPIVLTTTQALILRKVEIFLLNKSYYALNIENVKKNSEEERKKQIQKAWNHLCQSIIQKKRGILDSTVSIPTIVTQTLVKDMRFQISPRSKSVHTKRDLQQVSLFKDSLEDLHLSYYKRYILPYIMNNENKPDEYKLLYVQEAEWMNRKVFTKNIIPNLYKNGIINKDLLFTILTGMYSSLNQNVDHLDSLLLNLNRFFYKDSFDILAFKNFYTVYENFSTDWLTTVSSINDIDKLAELSSVLLVLLNVLVE